MKNFVYQILYFFNLKVINKILYCFQILNSKDFKQSNIISYSIILKILYLIPKNIHLFQDFLLELAKIYILM